MKRAHQLIVILAVATACGPLAPAADYVWIEGESPKASNAEALHNAWPHALLSGGRWLEISAKGGAIDKAPDRTVLLTYDFETDGPGSKQIWARIGYEMLRTPFDWRLDGGEWTTVKPDDWTTNLCYLRDWVTLGWLKLDETNLAAGNHKLQFRLKPETQKRGGNLIRFALDAVCVAAKFEPHQRYKPDEKWRTDRDSQAADQVF
jgi:hypothetical protein